jgi:hypothetical protein
VAFNYLKRKPPEEEIQDRWIEPHLGPDLSGAKSAVFDSGKEDDHRLRARARRAPRDLSGAVLQGLQGIRGPDRPQVRLPYWAERENFFLREFLKRQTEFTHVVQARHLISENEAAKQVLTRDAGITIADWLRVKPRYADTATLSHPFQRSDAFLRC